MACFLPLSSIVHTSKPIMPSLFADEKEKTTLASPDQLAANPVAGPLPTASASPDDSSDQTKVEYTDKAAMEGIEPAFLAKVHVLNDAIKEIGMGRYQYELFFTAGVSSAPRLTFFLRAHG